MNILLVTPYYIPAWGFGGPVRVVADLAQSFTRQGHHVTVATTDVLDQHKRISKKVDMVEGIPVHYFPNVSTFAAFRWNIFFPRNFATWLKKHIAEFDVVHCHDFFTNLNVTVSRVAKRSGVPYLIQPHGALIPIRQMAKFLWLKRAWLRVNKRVLQDAARVVASTPSELQEIHKHQKIEMQRLVCVPNGLSSTSIGRPALDVARRQQLGIGQDDYVILYFGRIQYIKGIDISLHALSFLQDLKWKYIIVGRDDGHLTELKVLVHRLGLKDRVVLLGQHFGKNLDALLGLSDVFLLNSRSESFPIAVLNACAAGLPVVISPECRIPEVARAGAGVVLGDNHPETTAAALRALLADGQRRQQMSEAGQWLVLEKFSLERSVQLYLQIYDAVRKRA